MAQDHKQARRRGREVAPGVDLYSLGLECRRKWGGIKARTRLPFDRVLGSWPPSICSLAPDFRRKRLPPSWASPSIFGGSSCMPGTCSPVGVPDSQSRLASPRVRATVSFWTRALVQSEKVACACGLSYAQDFAAEMRQFCAALLRETIQEMHLRFLPSSWPSICHSSLSK